MDSRVRKRHHPPDRQAGLPAGVWVDTPLQAMRVNAAGAASIAQIYSDGAGFTSLRYQEVFP